MEFRLPELGEGVHEGELVKWRVKPGDIVKHDQPLCEVMTDKATIEIPSAVEGRVANIHAKEGEVVQVGQLLLSYEGAGVSPSAATAPKTPTQAPVAPVPAVSENSSGEVLASPSTRRIAREAGVELSRVKGSGPSGRILREDIEKFIAGDRGRAQTGGPEKSFVPGSEERIPFVGLRKKIAEKMRLSKDKAAHFTYVEEADATELVRLRNEAKVIGDRDGVKVTYLPFVMKSMVAALQRYPMLNATLDEQAGQIVYKRYYNIGLSIQTEDGLTAPVLKNVESKSILELAREIQALVARARAKQLKLEDFQGGTITLTNAGSIGGLFATPVINYPEVAILGFNKIFRKPVVKEVNGHEQIVIRDWTYFSLSCDHRVVDGAVAAEFTKELIRYIETPGLLAL